MSAERLDKIISSQFNISRSQARKEILSGKVSVMGKPVRQPGFLVDVQTGAVFYAGQTVEYKKHVYILMNKPAGVLSASNDKHRQTVVDLVPEHLRRPNLFPVGRLDKDTTGLLIITDDGDFAHKVLSPKSGIFKTYIAELDGSVTDEMCGIFKDGVTLADNTSLRGAVLRSLGGVKAEIKISEGRYHQIKRMFGTVGLGVNALHRSALGKLTLPDWLSAGESCELTVDEIGGIFK